MRYQYKPRGTCSTQIRFDLEGDRVRNVAFADGCNGNLQALARLVEGMPLAELEAKLMDIRCDDRGTSCAAQLCQAVREAYEK